MAERVLFLAAPPESYVPHKDTTRVLMEEAARRGFEVWTAEHADLEVRDGAVYAWARPLTFPGEDGSWFSAGAPEPLPFASLHWVWFRGDPPFDRAYLHATRIVELAGVPAINAPHGLQAVNEKLAVLRFPELTPPTLLSRRLDALRAFVASVGGRAVIKPLDGFGGTGVFRLWADDPNFNVIVETVTDGGRRPALAQAYLEAIHVEGDVRLLLWDGEPLGAFRRIPRPEEFRGNMAQGGHVEAVAIDARMREVAAHLAPWLRGLGLRLVGLDLIGGYLTEVNVTSPTGFQEVRRLTGERPEAVVWERLSAEGARNRV